MFEMSEAGGVWVSLGVAFASVALAAAAFVVAWFRQQKAAVDTDATIEKQENNLRKRVDELTNRVFSLQDEVALCMRERADLRAEVAAQAVRLRHLEVATGTTPKSPLAGLLVADMKGTIRVCSPSLVPILGWLPSELEGKPITAVVPPETRAVHAAGIEAFVARGQPADPQKPVVTYALSKSGARVPVTIHLKSLLPEGLVSAEIRERASAGDGSGVNLGRPPLAQPVNE